MEAESIAPLRVLLLGPLRVFLPSGEVARFRTRKVQALLALLAYRKDSLIRRDELPTILWPEEESSAAGLRFRNALHHLRKLLEQGGLPAAAAIRSDHSCIGLSPDLVWTDVERFQCA